MFTPGRPGLARVIRVGGPDAASRHAQFREAAHARHSLAVRLAAKHLDKIAQQSAQTPNPWTG